MPPHANGSISPNKWAHLRSATNGDAEIEQALQALLTAPGDVDLEDLLDDLCHQGSLRCGSLEAIPMLVEAARQETADLAAVLLHRCACILCSNDLPIGVTSQDVASARLEFADRIIEYARPILRDIDNEQVKLSLAEGMLALKFGEKDLAAKMGRLEALIGGQLVVICPSCGTGHTLTDSNISLSPTTPSSKHAWLAELARHARLELLGQRIPVLFGTVECRRCGETVEVFPAVFETPLAQDDQP